MGGGGTEESYVVGCETPPPTETNATHRTHTPYSNRERLQRKAEQERQEKERELEAARARAAAAAQRELEEWKRKCGELERAYAEEKARRWVSSVGGVVWVIYGHASCHLFFINL